MIWRGSVKRAMSPSLATSVAAAIRPTPRSACSACTTSTRDNSAMLLRYVPQAVAPCRRCLAMAAMQSSSTVCTACSEAGQLLTGAPSPDALGRGLVSPRGPDPAQRPESVHPRGAAWQGRDGLPLSQANIWSSAGMAGNSASVMVFIRQLRNSERAYAADGYRNVPINRYFMSTLERGSARCDVSAVCRRERSGPIDSATDGGTWSVEKRHGQSAADAAAFCAVL